MDPLRLVLADDAPLLRQGLARLLRDAGFAIAGEAGDYDQLIRAVELCDPDVVITDLRMPPTMSDEGFRAVSHIRQLGSSAGVIVLSQFSEPEYAQDLLSRTDRGTGYLLKDNVDDVAQLQEAIWRVHAGECVVDETIVSALLHRGRRAAIDGRLTARELEVLAQMAQGRSNEGIGQVLFLSAKSVENYVGRIFKKLDLPAASSDHRRVLAVLRYLRD